MSNQETMKQIWENSFEEQIAQQAYNTAPVEALARSISYYLRDYYPDGDFSNLHFLEMGCGAGPNLTWLGNKGIHISGVDISSKALELCRKNLTHAGLENKIGKLLESSVTKIPFDDQSMDGVIEACVFQHLNKEDRENSFSEVKRVLKPGGLFVGYMLDAGHTIFQEKQNQQLSDDPGTLILEEGKSRFYLSNIGLSHFFRKEEYFQIFDGFSVVDPCLTTYYLPQGEAKKRGYPEYLQSMWTVYAIK